MRQQLTEQVERLSGDVEKWQGAFEGQKALIRKAELTAAEAKATLHEYKKRFKKKLQVRVTLLLRAFSGALVRGVRKCPLPGMLSATAEPFWFIFSGYGSFEISSTYLQHSACEKKPVDGRVCILNLVVQATEEERRTARDQLQEAHNMMAGINEEQEARRRAQLEAEHVGSDLERTQVTMF